MQFKINIRYKAIQKNEYIFVFIFLLFISNPIFSFSQNIDKDTSSQFEKKIVSNIFEWLSYEQLNINWSSNYITFDENKNIISKDSFLQKLISGEFYIMNIGIRNDSNLYQIKKSKIEINKDIIYAISSKAATEYNYYKLEGKALPDFNFEDIFGRSLNSNNTNGKIIVINCWYINCRPCVAELPELNKLVKIFKKDSSIIFIALAFDEKADLKYFLKTKKFDYTIIPNKENYLRNVLNIQGYPTHIIIDKQGRIKKITNCDLNILKQLISNEQ